MKLKIQYIVFFLLISNNIFALLPNVFDYSIFSSLVYLLNDYNAAIEIRTTDSSKFDDCFLQYNSHSTGSILGWRFLPAISTQKGYWFGGINISGSEKDVRFRIVGYLRSSNIYKVKVKKGCTTFIQMNIVDEISTNANLVYEIHNSTKITSGLLKINDINFQMTNIDISALNVFRLCLPIAGQIVEIGASQVFQYITKGPIGCVMLVFEKGNDEISIVKNINNVNTGTNQYLMSFDSSEFQNGVYWWHLEGEDSNGLKFQSESRKIIVLNPSDNNDFDGDGYSDNEELARGSKIDDVNDIPLIISSDTELPTGFRSLHYFFKLAVNDNRFVSSYNYCGDLPDGIAVSHDGIISGRALECGEFHFMITVENEIDHFDEQSFSLKIMEPTNSVVKFGRGGIK